MSEILYQIKDWDGHYENAKSRTIDKKSWCAVPNKRGLGYCRIMQQKDGASIYGAFMATVLLASNQTRPREGYLTDTGRSDGIPLTAMDISLVTQVPEKQISRMLDFCSGVTVGWITACGEKDTAVSTQGYHADQQYTSEGGKEGGNRKGTAVSFSEDVEKWNVLAAKVGLAQIREMGPQRAKHYKARLASNPDFWDVLKRELLNLGDFAKGSNDRAWKLSFDYCVESQDKFNKLAEGQFRRKASPRKGPNI